MFTKKKKFDHHIQQKNVHVFDLVFILNQASVECATGTSPLPLPFLNFANNLFISRVLKIERKLCKQ
jgi:hypothetical protein